LAQGADVPVTIFDSQFSRSTGKPVQATADFALPAIVHAPFTLFLLNGDGTGANRVSSARISLNGNELFGPADFSQSIGQLQQSVILSNTNTLLVELASAPGSLIEIFITAAVNSDTKNDTNAQPIGNAGGSVALPNVGQLFVPVGALPD
jgi:hypothetical protein